MIKVGVLGAGHLGKIHLKLLEQSKKYELIGFFDPDIANGQKVAKEFSYNYFDQLDALIDEVDQIFIEEARTPLIISGPIGKSSEMYATIYPLVDTLFSDAKNHKPHSKIKKEKHRISVCCAKKRRR